MKVTLQRNRYEGACSADGFGDSERLAPCCQLQEENVAWVTIS